jgi:uncharacterized protein YjbJ (UPF0337 family)
VGELENKVKGNAKEAAGDLTGDKSMQLEGKTDKARGKVQEGMRKADEGLHQEKGSLKPRDPAL